MIFPVILCALFTVLLFFLGYLATQQARQLQVQKAPTRKIVPFSLIAIVGNLLAVGMFVFILFLLTSLV